MVTCLHGKSSALLIKTLISFLLNVSFPLRSQRKTQASEKCFTSYLLKKNEVVVQNKTKISLKKPSFRIKPTVRIKDLYHRRCQMCYFLFLQQPKTVLRHVCGQNVPACHWLTRVCTLKGTYSYISKLVGLFSVTQLLGIKPSFLQQKEQRIKILGMCLSMIMTLL